MSVRAQFSPLLPGEPAPADTRRASKRAAEVVSAMPAYDGNRYKFALTSPLGACRTTNSSSNSSMTARTVLFRGNILLRQFPTGATGAEMSLKSSGEIHRAETNGQPLARCSRASARRSSGSHKPRPIYRLSSNTALAIGSLLQRCPRLSGETA